MMITLPPESLGSFYLGAEYDIEKKTISNIPVNYDSRDLTTHAVCVGMTGSGKTGLCIGLLEEAAIDQVPAIIIDPKGDMTNLLFQFEDLNPADFEKWINPDDAARKGMTVSEYAAATAIKWQKGLAEWGQGKERIRLLKNAVDYTIYTPGSDAGVSVNIMGSFAAPSVDFDSDAEMLRERIQGTVAALLGMIGSKEDPVRSREGILLSTLFEHYWRNNEDLDLAKLIHGVQKPPFKQLGVFDVDTFFPEKERFNLAMDFNTLVASPQFSYWLKGESLDIQKMYFTPEGKPKHSVFYIAHLSESERMFFVTLLLNSLITWMRKQSGTTSLRSLMYFDEIFGFFPPTSNPPSKKPLLTLLKQARAFGLGSVLVTQNPVDIDYKGLSNAGTWFIGKLQTQRDKERVLDGLKGAIAEAGSSSKIDFSQIISSLSSRVFLMHNVHADGPVVYHTRWAMSYLRGPLTRTQVKQLMEGKKEERGSTTSSNIGLESKPTVSVSVASKNISSMPPSIDPSVEQRFFAAWKSASEAGQELNSREELSLVYEPMILNIAKVRFFNEKRGVDVVKEMSYVTPAPDEFGRTDWEQSEIMKNWQDSLFLKPDHPTNIGVQYGSLPDSIDSSKKLTKVQKDFANWLYQNEEYALLEHTDLKVFKKSTESDDDFLNRVRQLGREKRDEELDKIQDRYEPKLERIRDRIRKEENKLDEREAEVSDRKQAEWIGVAETVLSMFVGRRRSISSAMSKRRMRRKAAEKMEASEDELLDLQEDFAQLNEELKIKLDELRNKWEHVTEGVSVSKVKPRRTDVKVESIILTWTPSWTTADGHSVRASKNS